MKFLIALSTLALSSLPIFAAPVSAAPKTLACEFFTQSASGQNESKTLNVKLTVNTAAESMTAKGDVILAGGRFKVSVGAVQPLAQNSSVKFDNIVITLDDSEKDIELQSGANTSSELKSTQNSDMANLNYTTDSSASGHPFVVTTCILK